MAAVILPESADPTAARVDTAGTFLGAGALAAFVFVPQFTAANIAAFCTYFATFAIFFFTALYLVEVAGSAPGCSPS